MLFVQWNLGLRTLRFTPVSARAQQPVENIAPVHVRTFSLRCELNFYTETEATSLSYRRTQTKTNKPRCT